VNSEKRGEPHARRKCQSVLTINRSIVDELDLDSHGESSPADASQTEAGLRGPAPSGKCRMQCVKHGFDGVKFVRGTFKQKLQSKIFGLVCVLALFHLSNFMS